jgi:hypothetical protein
MPVSYSQSSIIPQKGGAPVCCGIAITVPKDLLRPADLNAVVSLLAKQLMTPNFCDMSVCFVIETLYMGGSLYIMLFPFRRQSAYIAG